MPVKKKIQYKDYFDYLKSDKWKQVKEDYCENEETDFCLCCGTNMPECDVVYNFHHFRYPKDWNNDSWRNLIIVCETCHESLHITHEHNSEPKSLRSYIIDLLYTSRELHEVGVRDVEQADLWSGCEGRFSITQEGISSRKSMTFTVTTSDRRTIMQFERMRDHRLSKQEDSFL